MSIHTDRAKNIFTGIGVVLCTLLSRPARAQTTPDCATLPGSIYLTGASSVLPILNALQQSLGASATLVYQTQSTCTAASYIVSPPTKLTGTATYYLSNGTAASCTISTPTAADVAASELYSQSCPGGTVLPASVGDFHGFIETMVFAVPAASTHTAISAEAAYLTFGLGSQGGTSWSDTSKYEIRAANSAVEIVLGASINVPTAKWMGIQQASPTGVITALAGASAPDAAIGIVTTAETDESQAVKSLAFQAYAQNCAYWPDSSSATHDKARVRDGHYEPWSQIHFWAAIDASGNPTDTKA